MNREDQLKEHLQALQEEYKRRAQPIVDELAHIDSLKPPKPLLITMCPHCFHMHIVDQPCMMCHA